MSRRDGINFTDQLLCTPNDEAHKQYFVPLPNAKDKPAGSTARRKLCGRPKCEGRYRKNSAHYSFLGADTTSAANVPRSAQSTAIKSAGLDDRPWYVVAGPKISAAVYHCTALPVDPETARRSNAANDRGRIRKESAWSKPRPPAPKEMQSDWKPCSASVPVADDLSIPDFLKRVSESLDGILEAAE